MKSFKNGDFVWELRWLWLWLIRLLLDLITGVDGTVIYLLSRSLGRILQADIKINCFTREKNSVRRLGLWCRRRKKRENCLSWGNLSGEEKGERSSVSYLILLWVGCHFSPTPVSAVLWPVFTNECRVTSQEGPAGDNIIISQASQAHRHTYLFSFWKLDVRILKSFMLDVRHPLKLSDRKHIFSK